MTITNEKERVLRIWKVDSSDTKKTLGGAQFKIYDTNNKLVETINTDTKGRVEVVLSPGEYVVKESKAPSGYKLSDEEYKVDLRNIYEYALTVKNDLENGDVPEEPEEVEVPEEPIPEGPGTEGETPDEEETDTYTPPEGKKSDRGY